MAGLSPIEFALKWKGSTTTEKASAQEQFTDLCHLVGVPTPHEADPTGRDYAFEKGAEKASGGDGFADVWKRGHFAWEYKSQGKDLNAAYQQLLQYAGALDNPPLLVVSDLQRFQVHTNFNNTPKVVYEFDLNDLYSNPTGPMRILRAVMTNPEELKPGVTRAELTKKAAEKFAGLAFKLRSRGNESLAVAHFLNKLLFCLFAEDAGLLPPGLIKRLASNLKAKPDEFGSALRELFARMSVGGGNFGAEWIDWFNGGLFDGDEVLYLEPWDIDVLREAAALDWSQIEPAIFGTLFERGLDPDKRSQLGAHYTDRDSIMRLVDPVLLEPLRREFAELQARVAKIKASGGRWTAQTPIERHPLKQVNSFLARIRSVRVLDPACGSGNFLYIALQSLKNLERDVLVWVSSELQIPIGFPEVGPRCVHGIEINPYAAELARVTIWIGEIQWMLQNGFAYLKDPILQSLETIECRDALVREVDGEVREAEWPKADVIVGNPPFLGGKLLRSNLDSAYVDDLFTVFKNRVPPEADLVTYWFEKARAAVADGATYRVGLLATQGIRGGANRRVLERIQMTGSIFLAWSDEPWILDGAAVHISFIGFDSGSEKERWLNGKAVAAINSNLTAGLDLTKARRLKENEGIAFMGDTKGGPFDVDSATAQELLAKPNPDGRSNGSVVVPWINGLDITRRPRAMWIVDFGVNMAEKEAALYEAPFQYVEVHVRPTRAGNRREAYVRNWWLHMEPRPAMRAALARLDRFIVTPCISKHRLFAWVPKGTLPDHALIAVALDDESMFGILQSRLHNLWALRLGTQLETRPRYTPTTTFETFPFPQTDQGHRDAISEAARRLDDLRNGWLDPPGAEQEELKNRTLTVLYNQRPAWLGHVHRELDETVLAAYGWPNSLSDDEILERLLELNLSRAAAEHLPGDGADGGSEAAILAE
jgi:type II restriction/modification system DNA methylase subunit YeeA